MKELMKLYSENITGAISGWDRIRFRGTIRWLASTLGLRTYVSLRKILFKDFGKWAESITKQIRASCATRADELDIPMKYLQTSKVDKEALARKIAAEHGIEHGDICMFSVVEPCMAPMVKGDRSTKKLNIEIAPRKCVFIYHYWDDPLLGFGHTRLQTWIPLSVTACINGRHWLERQLQAESIDYVKDGNCFPYIADLSRAQELLDQQHQVNWPELLNGLIRRSCPMIHQAFPDYPLEYYWSADETELATDISFRSAADLDRIFPALLRFGMISANSPAIMRFFGRKLKNGKIIGVAPNEIISDLRRRYEATRLKHWINRNSIKMYNKAGNLLRIETTINNTRDFKVFRHPDDDSTRPASWQKLRKGVSDLHRRAQVSEACNRRYADHLATTQISEPLLNCAKDISQPTKYRKRRYRAINPWSIEDYRTLQFLADGKHHISGFRNRDLRRTLYPKLNEDDPRERSRASGRITRRISLLRAHGLIKKVPRTTRYLLTTKGRKITNAINAASMADTQKLMELAA